MSAILAVTEVEGGVVVAFKVVTRAPRDRLGDPLGDHLKLHITAPPVDNKANKQIVKFLAQTFGVAQNAVRIVQGEKNNRKRIFIPVSGRIFESKLEK